MRKRLISFLMSSVFAASLISGSGVYADDNEEFGSVTITVIDEETGELFKAEAYYPTFALNKIKGTILETVCVDSWNINESNPHTVDRLPVGYNYYLGHGYFHFDDFYYEIDPEKEKGAFDYLSSEHKDYTIYMKKNYWPESTNDIQPAVPDISYKIINMPDKVKYEVGEQIDLKGIQIEVTKGNEEPVIYTYPDVAFDYQSNIPKSPSVILSTSCRNDVPGTYIVEVVGAENVGFTVTFVDTGTDKDREYSFENIRNMSSEEIKALFESKGMTKDKGYRIWTKETILNMRNTMIGGVGVNILPDPDKQTSFNDSSLFSSDLFWEQEKLEKTLGLPKELFEITQLMKGFSSKGTFVNCYIYPKAADEEAEAELYAAAYNYIQLSPYFVDFSYEMLGGTGGTTTSVYNPTYTTTTTTTAEMVTSTKPVVTENNEDLDIIFKDNDLKIDKGTEKSFEYEIIGTNDVSFLSDSIGIKVSNAFENGKGTLTVKENGASVGKNFIKCFLGADDNSKTKTIAITVNKSTTFHCPDCGRDVPIEDKISGAARAVCKDCYEKGQSVGSTVPPETSVTVTTTSTTVISTTAEPVKGDANCDGELSMGDAVLIMQSIANPAKFSIKGTNENHLTEQGSKNADIAGDNDGITNSDALAIQKKLLKLD